MLCSVVPCGNPSHAKGLCRSHYNKAHYAANSDAAKARSRAWSAANPDKASAHRAQRDPQSMRDDTRRRYWADRTRGVVAAANSRAKKAGAAGRLTPDGVRARFAYFGGTCWICGQAGADSIDHVISLGVGGPNFNSNIRPAHLGCNAARSWEGRN